MRELKVHRFKKEQRWKQWKYNFTLFLCDDFRNVIAADLWNSLVLSFVGEGEAEASKILTLGQWVSVRHRCIKRE